MKPYKSGEHPVNYSKDLKVMYISNLATMFEYRNQGIATKLIKHAIQQLEEIGYDYAYYRTIKENSMSYSIGIKYGFTEIPNIIQYVHCSKIDGSFIRSAKNFFGEKVI